MPAKQIQVKPRQASCPAPPGLELPQQLAHSKSGSSLSSEAESTSASEASQGSWAPEGPYQVHLRGLPNAVLHEEIMQVMLEEANLWHAVLSLSVARDCKSQRGDALVTLANEAAANWCVCHFHGCGWGALGKEVRAEILEEWHPSDDDTKSEEQEPPATKCKDEELITTSRLSATALEFVPFDFSVDAAVFVPAGYESKLDAKDSAQKGGGIPSTRSNASVSTASQCDSASDVELEKSATEAT